MTCASLRHFIENDWKKISIWGPYAVTWAEQEQAVRPRKRRGDRKKRKKNKGLRLYDTVVINSLRSCQTRKYLVLGHEVLTALGLDLRHDLEQNY